MKFYKLPAATVARNRRKAERDALKERLPYAHIGIGGEWWLTFHEGDSSTLEIAVRPGLDGFREDRKFKGFWVNNSKRLDIEDLAQITAAFASRLEYALEQIADQTEAVRRVRSIAQGDRLRPAAGKEKKEE